MNSSILYLLFAHKERFFYRRLAPLQMLKSTLKKHPPCECFNSTLNNSACQSLLAVDIDFFDIVGIGDIDHGRVLEIELDYVTDFDISARVNEVLNVQNRMVG